MDGSSVYFINPIYGPGEQSELYRRDNTGVRTAFRVSKLISICNNYKHGVDVFDQIRKLFGVDLAHPTNWYCNKCNVAFHSDCFNSFHKVNSPNCVPK